MKKIEREVKKYSKEKYDLIIVGGGIYGVMLSLEASRRHLRSLFLEKDDFCGKTSHNHLRTVHGGIRYLQTLDLPRFKESIGERKWFLKYFPDFVNVMPCLMPLYNKGIYRKSILKAALLMNDILSFNRNSSVNEKRHLPNGKILSQDETREVFPMIDAEDLKGGAVWYDATLTEYQRFYIELLKLASGFGASALNYVKVKGLLKHHKEVAGVGAVDKVSGSEVEFKAPVVINATGPWSRETAESFDKDYPQLFKKRLLLWNVLFDRNALSSHALGLSTKKGGGHTYFIHPWKNRLLVGTGEILVEQNESETTVPAAELGKFIEDINNMVPGLVLSDEDVLRIYPGVLPAEENGRLSARPALIDHGKNGGAKGLYSLSGVKFTTSRLVADRTLNGIFPGIKKISYDKIFEKGDMEFIEFDYRYEPEGEKDMNILADIVKKEAVVHLDDLILRRTSIGDNPERALKILPKIRNLFDWQDKEWQEEMAQLKQRLKEGFNE
jgi:glycerol-3-phosphate dehydrogenase